MQVIYLTKEQIKYHQTAYDQALVASIKRVKIQIALKIKLTSTGYECVDGNKRLSIINDYQLDFKIPCLLVNDFSKQGSSYWGAMNHH